MASPTKASSTIRIAHARNLGRKRKRALHKKGTTRTEAQLFGNVLSRNPGT